MKILIKIGIGVSVALNLFVFTVAMYGLITREERVEENRKWLKETIEKEVYDQIKFVMPKESGGVSCVINNCSGVYSIASYDGYSPCGHNVVVPFSS